MIYKKTAAEIEMMRASGRILRTILDELEGMIVSASRQGIGLEEQVLENRAQELLQKHSVKSPFKGYQGYPYAACVSINEEVVHGIPDQGKQIPLGALIGIDLGVVKNDLMVDAAITVPYGEISNEDKRLLEVTKEALRRGIEQARPGNRVGDISAAVQETAEAAGFHAIRNLSGHGIGRSLHEEPSIFNVGKSGEGALLEAGMTICIEPMIAIGSDEVVIVPHEWPARTKDGSKSAHFEHTVAITESGPLVLTE